MENKMSFDEWVTHHYTKISGTERYHKIPYIENELSYSTDRVINHYLEYFNEKSYNDSTVWDGVDMRKNEIAKIIFDLNEENLYELDTGEAPHPMVVGRILNHNICQFYNSKSIPKNSDKDYEGTILSIHPVIFNILYEWIGEYVDELNWRGSNIKDFWECFVEVKNWSDWRNQTF